VAFAAGGFTLGLATIDRPSVMVFFIAVPVAIYLAAQPRSKRESWIARLVVTAVACAIPIAPVMIRTTWSRGDRARRRIRRRQLLIGNNPNSDGSTAIVPARGPTRWGGYYDAIAIAEKDAGHKLNLAQVSDYYFAKGKQFIREHPTRHGRSCGRSSASTGAPANAPTTSTSTSSGSWRR
jgi:hypothetical protein